MTISIITVVYNNNETIAEAIGSVLGQTCKDIEYIIIDGGSTDGTVETINQYKGSIDKFISEPDKGIYDAMNKGLQMASGDIIGILNSDDLYADADVLKDVWQSFADNPETDILYGDLVYVKRNDVNKTVRKWQSKPYFKNFFEWGNVPPHPALFVRAGVYKQAGLFNLQYKLAADYEFMLRIFKKYNFKSEYMNRLMVKMRLGGATNKSFANIWKGNKEIWASWKNNGLTAPPQLMPSRIIKRLSQFLKQ